MTTKKIYILKMLISANLFFSFTLKLTLRHWGIWREGIRCRWSSRWTGSHWTPRELFSPWYTDGSPREGSSAPLKNIFIQIIWIISSYWLSFVGSWTVLLLLSFVFFFSWPPCQGKIIKWYFHVKTDPWFLLNNIFYHQLPATLT